MSKMTFDPSFEESGQDSHDKGLAKAVLIQDKGHRMIFSLVLTREEIEEPCYRLSMVMVVPESDTIYDFVPDRWSDIISKAFFGATGQKVENPSGLSTAKQYVQMI